MPVKNPSFVQTLKALRSGQTSDELDEALAECMSATELTGKSSSMTVKVVVKPKGFGAFVITDDVKTTLPKFDRESTVLFTTEQGHLVREDPRQQKLDLNPLQKTQQTHLAELPPEASKSALKTLS